MVFWNRVYPSQTDTDDRGDIYGVIKAINDSNKIFRIVFATISSTIENLVSNLLIIENYIFRIIVSDKHPLLIISLKWRNTFTLHLFEKREAFSP